MGLKKRQFHHRFLIDNYIPIQKHLETTFLNKKNKDMTFSFIPFFCALRTSAC